MIVASVISKALSLPLDVIIIKKIGFPGNEEFAIGAAGLDVFHIDEGKISEFGINKKSLDIAVKSKQKEARERYDFLSRGRVSESLEGKNVILVDDGIATGETMSLAVQILKKKSVKKIIVAVPVASEDSLAKLNADEVICLLKSKTLSSIGEFYVNFLPVEDNEVKKILENE